MCPSAAAAAVDDDDDDDGNECDVGEHSDVWGIGCLIYHMITGVPIHDSFRHDPRDDIPNKVRVFYLHQEVWSEESLCS